MNAKRFLTATLAMGMFLMPASAFAQVVIDDFSETGVDPSDLVLSTSSTGSVTDTKSGLTAAHTVGGQRDITMNVTANPLGLAVSTTVAAASDDLWLAVTPQAQADLTLEYGGLATVGSPGPDLNIDATGLLDIYFDVVSAELGGSVTIALLLDNDGSDGGPTTKSDTASVPTTPGRQAIGLDGFGGGLISYERADIDGIRFELTGPTAWDGTLDELGFSIPEPATMSLLALGGLGVLIRRKKR